MSLHESKYKTEAVEPIGDCQGFDHVFEGVVIVPERVDLCGPSEYVEIIGCEGGMVSKLLVEEVKEVLGGEGCGGGCGFEMCVEELGELGGCCRVDGECREWRRRR